MPGIETQPRKISRREALGILGMKASAVGILLGGSTAIEGIIMQSSATQEVQAHVNEFLGVVHEHDLQAAEMSAQTIDQKEANGEKLSEAEIKAKPAFDVLAAIKARKEQLEVAKWKEINNREVLGMRSITLRRWSVFGGGGTAVASVVAFLVSLNAWIGPVDDREYLS